MESNRKAGVAYATPRTLAERHAIADACALGLKLSLPTLIDDMDSTADRTYGAWPERLYVVSTEGVVVYQGGKGPYGFDPEALERFLEDYLADGKREGQGREDP
jgi:hypothetical protein